jgi:hypothetical protein
MQQEIRVRPWRGLILVLLTGFGCIHVGTPMNSSCRELPTIEECQTAARVITNDCLKKCVEMQCTGIKINCNSEEIRKRCRDRNTEGIVALGYVVRFSNIPTSCEHPLNEINWCEEPTSRECRAKAMVHELAHSCGWSHNQGFGVPGDDGFLRCQ